MGFLRVFAFWCVACVWIRDYGVSAAITGHCGTWLTTKPTLGIKVADVSGANTGGSAKILARVYASGEWSSWKALYHQGCTNWKKGLTYFFDDFSSVTARWDYIQLYACNANNLAIAQVFFWDPNSSADRDRQLDLFESGVVQWQDNNCMGDSVGEFFNYVWLDGSTSGNSDPYCEGLLLETQHMTRTGAIGVASAPPSSFTADQPSCTSYDIKKDDVEPWFMPQPELTLSPKYFVLSFQDSAIWLLIVCSLALMACNCALWFGKASKQNFYKAVAVVSEDERI